MTGWLDEQRPERIVSAPGKHFVFCFEIQLLESCFREIA